jgi:hypothetical protein
MAVIATISITASAETKVEYKDVHSICVVSQLEDTLALSRIGITIFGNGSKTIPIDDWKLNDDAARILANELGSKFTIAPVEANGTMGCTSMHVAPDSGVDAYVVLAPAAQVVLSKNLLHTTGIGLSSQSIPIGSDLDYIHAYTLVTVMDARTGKQIDYGTAGITRGVILGDSVPPQVRFDASEWPDPPNPPSPELLEKAHNTILGLLKQSVPYALQKAGLY